MRAAALPTTTCSRIPRCITGREQHNTAPFSGAGKGENLRLFNILKTAFTKLGAISDYVTEEIESSTYYIRKWNSGKVELFQEQTFSKPNVTNWTTYTSAGLYYGNFKITFPSVVNFSEAPRVYASPGKVGSNVGWVGSVTSTETTASMAIVRNGNSGDVVIKIHAIGTWGGVIRKLLFQRRWISCGYSPC